MQEVDITAAVVFDEKCTHFQECIDSLISQTKLPKEIIVANQTHAEDIMSPLALPENGMPTIHIVNMPKTEASEALLTISQYASCPLVFTLYGNDWIEANTFNDLTKETDGLESNICLLQNVINENPEDQPPYNTVKPLVFTDWRSSNAQALSMLANREILPLDKCYGILVPVHLLEQISLPEKTKKNDVWFFLALSEISQTISFFYSIHYHQRQLITSESIYKNTLLAIYTYQEIYKTLTTNLPEVTPLFFNIYFSLMDAAKDYCKRIPGYKTSESTQSIIEQLRFFYAHHTKRSIHYGTLPWRIKVATWLFLTFPHIYKRFFNTMEK